MTKAFLEAIMRNILPKGTSCNCSLTDQGWFVRVLVDYGNRYFLASLIVLDNSITITTYQEHMERVFHFALEKPGCLTELKEILSNELVSFDKEP